MRNPKFERQSFRFGIWDYLRISDFEFGISFCEVIMKPGWKTTEFWLTLLTALPGIAVTAGLIPTADKTMLDSAASKIAAGLLAAITVAKYVHSRALVKGAPPVSLVILAVLACAGPAAAGQPAPPNCWLPWRSETERRLQQLEQPRQQPPP